MSYGFCMEITSFLIVFVRAVKYYNSIVEGAGRVWEAQGVIGAHLQKSLYFHMDIH